MCSKGELGPTATPRRVDLNCLPLAVKSNIARLCAEQDRMLGCLLDSAPKSATADFSNAFKVFDARRNGSSIGNLFCVSEEWSNVAAPFRFEARFCTSDEPADGHLTRSRQQKLNLKQSRSAIFSMRIIHLRGEHFKEISLVHAKQPDLVRFVSLLPQMPNVSIIATSDFRMAAVNRPPYVEMDPPETAYLEAAMYRLFGRVKHISLYIKTVAVLPDLVSADVRSRLAHLSLHFARPNGFAAFIETLIDLRNLTELDLLFDRDFRTLDAELTAIVRSASTAGRLPQLRKLIIHSPDISPAVLDFISLSASTLVALGVVIASYDSRFLAQNPQGAIGLNGPFPCLEGLVLEGNSTALEGPLGSLTDANMPRLKRLAYSPHRWPPKTDRRTGEPPIPAPHRLIPLDYIGVAPVEPIESPSDLKQLPVCQLPTKSLVLRDARYGSLLWYSRGPVPAAASEFEIVKAKVQTTLDFLRTWRERATSQHDTVSLVTMARSLCQVELQRIAHEA